MHDPAELVGRLVGMALLACPAIYFLVRGLQDGPRSRRLANFALFCGLTAFVIPDMAFRLSPAHHPGLFLTSAAVRVLLGIVGLVLAVAALVTRRDGGVGVARPVTGASFSLLQLLAGVGLLCFVFLFQSATPWVYQSPDGTYRLTLPSPQWKQARTTGGVGIVAFVRPAPRMQASVLAVERDQTEADFLRAAEAFRTQAESASERRGQAKLRDGTNAAGNSYCYFTVMDSTPEGKQVFEARSVIWCPRKQMILEVIFQALPTMVSETGRAAEMEAIEKSAETICLSAE